MIYPIVKFGDPVLETPAAKVTAFDDELKKLIDEADQVLLEPRSATKARVQAERGLDLA